LTFYIGKPKEGVNMLDEDKMQIQKIINDTVNSTVLKLKMAGLMKDDRKTAYEKTEELLRNYNAFKDSDQPYTIKLVKKINAALFTIKDDIYYDIIPMYYFDGETREMIAEYYDTTVTTISRNKTRLINKIKPILFSDDVIYELFL
jgi:DNA-directed RNA polymerase specialized sigma subunit